MNSRQIFNAALRREPVPRPPVWLMRQAGRYMSQYQKLRKQHGFMELCHRPELACEVTLQPMQAFALDAAIIFSDILVTAEALGFGVDIVESKGPVISNPLSTAADLDRLRGRGEAAQGLEFVAQALSLVRRELPQDKALLGFAGAPMTVASYAIEGGASQRLPRSFSMIAERPELFEGLLRRITDLTIDYVRLQRTCGVDAVQIFESWAGLLPIDLYLRHAFPHLKRLVAELSDPLYPLILFAQGPRELLEHFCGLKVQAVSVGHDHSMAAVRRHHPGLAVQGNLDPRWLLTPTRSLLGEVDRILDSMRGLDGYIFNLSHGITPDVQPDAVRALVDHIVSR